RDKGLLGQRLREFINARAAPIPPSGKVARLLSDPEASKRIAAELDGGTADTFGGWLESELRNGKWTLNYEDNLAIESWAAEHHPPEPVDAFHAPYNLLSYLLALTDIVSLL